MIFKAQSKCEVCGRVFQCERTDTPLVRSPEAEPAKPWSEERRVFYREVFAGVAAMLVEVDTHACIVAH